MIGKTVSHYKILEKLGEGGMGEVYLAQDTELERKLALKFLPKGIASDPEALARFKREAQAAAALNHPNIITVYEIGRHDDQSFIAMAYIDGELVSDELKDGIPLERALDIAVQVCDGLDKAHHSGIVHRDIKPENLLLDPDGRVKILDFGLATFGRRGRAPGDDSTAGTVFYMSPEQVRGDEVDARGDVFSVGAVLYEMLAGKRPFEGGHAEAIRYSILHEEPPPLSRLNPRVTPQLERIVAKALAKDPSERYPSTALMATDLRSLAAGPKAARTGRGWISPRRLAIPGALVLLATAFLVLVNPFKVEISSEQNAIARENTVAIMYFENIAERDDPRRLGEIITDLLITNLSQSQDLKIVSSQRLYDILKHQGKEGAKVIDRTTATQIAQTAGARWMMLGSILQVEPKLVVTSQLVDVATGNVESSQRLTGVPGETVFDLVDRMTGDTRTELEDPVKRAETEPRPVAEVTTNSLEAYRHYLEGIEYDRRFYNAEACESFRRALEYDSTFAMAHLRYGWSCFGLRNYREGFLAVNRAARYIDGVSEKERLYLEASKAMVEGRYDESVGKFEQIVTTYPDDKDAYTEIAIVHMMSGDYEKSIENLRKVVELDPMDKMAYNQMAYVYDYLGDFEKSIWAINKYIELAPEEPNPYDTRGDLYAYHGDIDNAIVSYRKAIEIKPDARRTIEKLGHMHLYKGQYDQAEVQYSKLATSDVPELRSRGRYCLSKIPLYQGRLHEGLAALEGAIAADQKERTLAESYLYKLGLRVRVLTDLKLPDRSHSQARRFREAVVSPFPNLSVVFNLTYAVMCMENGRLAEADSVVGTYESVLDTLDQGSLEHYYLTKGSIALGRGDPEAAIRHLESADRLGPNKFQTRLYLARAYLAGNRIEEAIAILANILTSFDEDRLFLPTDAVRGHYVLGTAYQRAGRNTEAAEQFETFLGIWKDADPELDEVADARRRLDELRASTSAAGG